jgi:NAD+ synthase (glutamine-hydrolysing)
MKIALAQLNYHIGNFESNFQKISNACEAAIKEKSDLIIFSELAICGYPPRDFLEFDDFILKVEDYLNKVSDLSNEIAIIIGAPSRNPNKKGKPLYNAAFFLNNGKIESVHHKSLLPNYDIFDEYRYFESGKHNQFVEFKGKKLGITICEDIWNVEGSYLYSSSPLDELSKNNLDLIINIAASPFSYKQIERRKKVFDYNINKYKTPIAYVNHIGAQTELIFDGGSCFIDKEAKAYSNLNYFEEGIDYHHLGETTAKEVLIPSKYERIYAAIITGLRDYFKKLGFQKATLGLSGGIDSALTLAIAADALGPENLIPILLPSQFSSSHSISDSIELCNNLNCNYHQIEIESIFDQFLNQLGPLFKGTEFDLTEENIQSRIRGTLLMAYSNKFGAILLNTSNKSEIAVGYGTLYGDMAGGISVIGDLYKTEVYELSNFMNRNGIIIPEHILIKEPSAELRPDQKDSDSLPNYEDLDRILFEYIENRMSPSGIINLGLDKGLVLKTLKMVNINEYKRHQTAPILRVSEKAFGMGRRMPIVGKYLS